MSKGRRPSPAQLQVVKGNFRPDRHTHGPKVETGLPPCPKWLSRAARRHWSEIGPKLAEAGLIGAVDGDVFAAHCDTVSLFAEVCRELRSVEQATEQTPQGYLAQSALFAIRCKLHEQLVKSAREFGMTPAARSGIKEQPQQQLPLDGWADV